MHENQFICARVIFFTRSPKIMLIHVLLLRCDQRESCTNVGLESFMQPGTPSRCVAKQHELLHTKTQILFALLIQDNNEYYTALLLTSSAATAASSS